MVEKLHPVDETATLLKVSKHTIRSWFYQRRLTGIKLGRRLMFSENELQKFIEQGKKVARTYFENRN